jgi:DNA polymerase-3 subunit beta
MLTLNRKNLSLALAAIKPAVNKKATLPVLAYMKAEYIDGTLILTATNLEMYAARAVSAQADHDAWPAGGTCLEFSALEAALKGKADTVTLKVDQAGAYITAGAVTARVPVLIADEFPPAPPIPADPVHWLTVDAESFVDTFRRIAIATSTDEARPVLTGVHMRIDKGALSMQAADGFRLLRTRYTPLAHSEAFEVNVPYRIGKLLDKLTSRTLRLVIDPSRNTLHILGDTNNEHICSQLIDGSYPDLNQVIPIKCQHSVSFLTDESAEALAPFRAQMGILRVSYTAGTLNLAIHNEEHSIETALPCTLESDEPADLAGFDPDLLKQLVQAMQRKGQAVKVVMDSTIPQCAVKFTTPNADPDFVAILMPMQIF